jgi:alanine dehydrogenase
MIIGIPKEIKDNEYRVAMTPAGVEAMVAAGHRVLIERSAGEASGFSDLDYGQAGASVAGVAEAWGEAQMVVKVKEPLPVEYPYLRKDLIVYTYLHLAADETLTRVLVEREVTGVGYETVQASDGALPLLIPMSEIAGRIATQAGAHYLEKENGGWGILLGGATGVKPAEVVILGGGTVGINAARVALGMGANVTIFDQNLARLRYLGEVLHGRLVTMASLPMNVDKALRDADLVVGSVLVAGYRTPHLVSRETVRGMKPGAVIVDVAIDQGGCFETSRPTSHSHPTYTEEGVIHYCVTNMPGAVPHTSTLALTNATLPYALEMANLGLEEAARRNPTLARGLNTYRGKVTRLGVAEASHLEYTPLSGLIAGAVD